MIIPDSESGSEARLPCLRCSTEGQMRVGQSVLRDELRWYESTRCDSCGLRAEADGIGFPPEYIREQILATSGQWKLVLKDVKSIPGTVKVLTGQLSFNTKQALSVLRADGDVTVYNGTNAEATWLAGLLEKVGETPLLLCIN